MSKNSVTAPTADQLSVAQFPAIWSVLGYLGNWLSFFFLGFFAIYIFTSEFSNRTYRQNVITGISRSKLFFSKILFLSAIAGFATVVYLVSALVIGLYFSHPGVSDQMFDRIYLVPRYALMCFGYMSLGILISIVVRKTAVTVFLYFAYILFFEVLLRWSFHRKIINNSSMDFYPANAFEDLIPMPLQDWSVTQQFVQNNEGIHFLTGSQAVITSIIYIILIIGTSHQVMLKRDL